jgi:DNA-binding XRE family transcriptional regulator
MARRRTHKRYGEFAAHLQDRLPNPRFRKQWEQVHADMALATQLIRLRTEQGLTQAQVAEMVRTSQSCLSRLERHPPRKVTPLLKRLADLYGREIRVEIHLLPSR